MLISSRLSHTNEAASLIHKTSDIGQNCFINPVLCATERSVRIPDIDDDFNLLRDTFSDIIKGNELHFKRHSAQAFQHSLCGIGFPVPDGMMYLIGHPSSLTAPAIQDCHLKRCCIGSRPLHILMDLTELCDHILYFINKAWPFACKLQITAISNPVQWGSQQCTPCFSPVVPCLSDRVTTFTEHIREKVWQQPSFRIIDTLDIGNHTKCHAASDRSYYRIQSDAFKIFTIRFRSDPMISKEHHGFLTIGMHNIYQFFRQCAYLDLLELYEIKKLSARHPEHTVVISLIHNVLRTEFISCPFLKLFQNIGTHTCTISKPLYVFFPFLIIKGQCKLMKKSGKTYNINMWVVLTPFFQLLFDILSGLWLSHIIGQLMRCILPVIRNEIIHVHRIPN